MTGWQAVPPDKTRGAFGQTVNGNYGFGSLDYDPDSPGDAQPGADGGPATVREPAGQPESQP